jgi:hypothetical protein
MRKVLPLKLGKHLFRQFIWTLGVRNCYYFEKLGRSCWAGVGAACWAFFVCHFGFNAQHLFLSIKIIKQIVVITSCCNIMLFYHVNAQQQFLLSIKQSDAVLSCCFVVLFDWVNAQHQFLSIKIIKLSDAVLSCCFVMLFGWVNLN